MSFVPHLAGSHVGNVTVLPESAGGRGGAGETQDMFGKLVLLHNRFIQHKLYPKMQVFHYFFK